MHGLADSVALGWRATGVLDRLTAAGLRTVAYDARGHGMSMRATAVAVLEGRQAPDAAMQGWLDFLEATHNDKAALAAVLRGHRPVVQHWDRITVPTVVAAGVDDATAAPTADVVSRLPHGRSLHLPGDHLTAMAAPAFTDVIIELAG